MDLTVRVGIPVFRSCDWVVGPVEKPRPRLRFAASLNVANHSQLTLTLPFLSLEITHFFTFSKYEIPFLGTAIHLPLSQTPKPRWVGTGICVSNV